MFLEMGEVTILTLCHYRWLVRDSTHPSSNQCGEDTPLKIYESVAETGCVCIDLGASKEGRVSAVSSPPWGVEGWGEQAPQETRLLEHNILCTIV